jgi:hypothetical protein
VGDIATENGVQIYEFCVHKALEMNPVLVELGSEGNAFDGSPSPFASSTTL